MDTIPLAVITSANTGTTVFFTLNISNMTDNWDLICKPLDTCYIDCILDGCSTMALDSDTASQVFVHCSPLNNHGCPASSTNGYTAWTYSPTNIPSSQPTTMPSNNPTIEPTIHTINPSQTPTYSPSLFPTCSVD